MEPADDPVTGVSNHDRDDEGNMGEVGTAVRAPDARIAKAAITGSSIQTDNRRFSCTNLTPLVVPALRLGKSVAVP
jgi:hypothetical protein